MRSGWLLRGRDVVLAALEWPRAGRPERGPAGAGSGYEGAMHVPGTRAVHTVGMRFPLDVAFLDRDLVVLDVTPLQPVADGPARADGPHMVEAAGRVAASAGSSGRGPARDHEAR